MDTPDKPDINIKPDGAIVVGSEEEIGRRLKASDLKVETIVVVKPPNTSHTAISMWIIEINKEPPKGLLPYVVFYSGILKMPILNFINESDEIYDRSAGIVEVYEYLGKE